MKHHSPLWSYLNLTVPCYGGNISPNGIWKSTNPLIDAIPIVVSQLAIAIFVVTIFLLVFRPLGQPYFVILILAGTFLGPSGLGGTLAEFEILPRSSLNLLDPFGHFAIVNYAFLLGLETDLSMVQRSSQMDITTAAFNTILPGIMGSILFFVVGNNGDSSEGFVYWAVALAATGAPAIMAEQLDHAKIYATDIAKTALSVAQITDLSSWGLLALASTFTGSGGSMATAILATAILSTISVAIFIFLCIFYMQPAMKMLIEKAREYKIDSDEYFFCGFIAAGVGLFGFFANTMGAHPAIGAFAFGLIVPRGAIEVELFEKFEGFTMWILMPFFMVTVGQRIDFWGIASDGAGWANTVVVLVIAGFSKSIAVAVSSFVTGMDPRKSFALGILMNTKSMFAIMALSIGLEEHVLSDRNYTILVIGLLLMTISVTPFTFISGRKRQIPYKRRTMHKIMPDEELRLLVCLSSVQDIHNTIGLFDAAAASRNSPVVAFAAHLILPNSTSSAVETDQILAAFDKYVYQRENITVNTFTIKSSYTDAEEEICDAAEERRTNLIVLPFHRQQGPTGELELIAPTREMNESVLSNAPCSVGIFIDRGLASSGKSATKVAMIFVGGPDDREALAYAVRMARNPEITLKVTRLIPSETANQFQYKSPIDISVNLDIESERDKDQDDSVTSRIREDTNIEDSSSTMEYEDIIVDNEEQVIELMKGMDGIYDLFVVGKGGRYVSPLTSGLADWCEYPELGPIGDVLVTTRFSSSFSVLVVKQYDPMGILNTDRPSVSDEIEASSLGLQKAAVDDGSWFEGR